MQSNIHRVLVSLGIMSGLVLAVGSPAAATPSAPADASTAAVRCGYNDNINGRAVWRNCDSTVDYIRTTNFIGGESYQCAPANSNYDLGPTWFIDNSVLIGFC